MNFYFYFVSNLFDKRENCKALRFKNLFYAPQKTSEGSQLLDMLCPFLVPCLSD